MDALCISCFHRQHTLPYDRCRAAAYWAVLLQIGLGNLSLSIHLHGIQQFIDGSTDAACPVVPHHFASHQGSRAEQFRRRKPPEPNGMDPALHIHNGFTSILKAELQLILRQYL